LRQNQDLTPNVDGSTGTLRNVYGWREWRGRRSPHERRALWTGDGHEGRDEHKERALHR
jgi:hypothetical protein